MTNYEKILKQLERKLSALIASLLRNGATEQQIISAARNLIREFNPYKRLSTQFLNDADSLLTQVFLDSKEKLTWIEMKTRPKPSRKALNTLIVGKSQFAMLDGTINMRVVDALKKAIKEKLTAKEFTDLVQKAISGSRYQANTISNTALQGYSSANRIDMERAAGVKFWKYSGPPAERSFCTTRFGKQYSYEEITAMDNNQNLPVLYYGGGWNCPHFWEAVITPDLIQKGAK